MGDKTVDSLFQRRTRSDSSTTRPDDLYAIIPNRARGYAKLATGELRNADLADTSNKVPGGGMVSTAVDLARFAIALHTNKLLRPGLSRRCRSP